MRDARDEHEPIGIVHRVDDPIVTDADPIVISAGELDDASRPWLSRERIDRGADSLSQLQGELIQLSAFRSEDGGRRAFGRIARPSRRR